MTSLQKPYLIFLGDVADQLAAKTGDGVAHWRPDWCVGQLRLDGCRADLGLDDVSLEQGREQGARTLLVGVANRGGVISDEWMTTLSRALDLGFDIASGLHTRLQHIPRLNEAASANGVSLFDVRYPEINLAVANGRPRCGKRLLTVGTDVSCGKMFTALAIEREMRARGMPADFRATGQTGIFIADSGIAVDAVIADFISGAAEWLTPANDPNHWDLVEGQGSLFHASYAGVTLGLIHGSQPDRLVLCHDPVREHMRGLPGYSVPSLADCIELNENVARLTNRDCRVCGLSINTSSLGEIDADALLADIEQQTGLPTVDAYRQGAVRLVDAL